MGGQASDLLYASENTMAQYGDLLNFAVDNMPLDDFKIMVVTAKDILPDGMTSDDHNWGAGVGCDPYTATKDDVDADHAFNEVKNRFAQRLWDSSVDEDNPFLSEGDLVNVTRNETTVMDNVLTQISMAALQQSPSALAISEMSEHLPEKLAILILPEDYFEKDFLLQAYSGVALKFINGIDFDERSDMLSIIGHELGHALNRHINLPQYYCQEIDHESLSTTNINEGKADIIGAEIVARGFKEGLISSKNISSQEEALRSMGTFHSGQNSLLAYNMKGLNNHMTNLAFDADAPNFGSTQAMEDAPRAHEVIMDINSVADALAGFLYAKNYNLAIANNPEDYSEEEKSYYQKFSNDPKDIVPDIESYASLGSYVRHYFMESDYHFAALSHLKESGALDDMRETLQPQYQVIHDDALADYFDAFEKYGSDELKNSPHIGAISEALGDDFKVSAVVDRVLNPKVPAESLDTDLSVKF